MPFVFRNLLLVHYFNSNFQPFPIINTIGHIVHGQYSACAKKIKVIQLGGGGGEVGANH